MDDMAIHDVFVETKYGAAWEAGGLDQWRLPRLMVDARKSMDLRLGGAVVAPAPQPPRDPALSIARVIEIVHEHIRRGSEDNAASWREGGNNAVD